ncbi:MAG: fasciclin domain-containing protein [Bacteroidaceae bacterium]|nr:fasciclin domain-containing protein [Bacteroidaceae bacterium]
MIQARITRRAATGILALAIAAIMPSCSDDHFDVNTAGGEGDNATLTLWQQISSNANLSNFASIVEKTPAFKDEKHLIQGYTFKDVLNGTQVLTVFAPNNDAFTAEDVRIYDSILQVRPYDVFLRLVGNHIARNRYVATGTSPTGKAESIVLVNNKKADFDRQAKTFKGIAFEKANIGATNGVLHIMAQQAPFAYNVYEYIRANNNTYRHLNAWLEQHDTLYFNSNASAEAGSNPETGEPIYVDSVYTRFNSLYFSSYEPASVEWAMPHKGLAANIESEDSVWAMVLPSDAAWEEASAKMNSWYNYAAMYYDKTKEDALVKDDPAAKNNMRFAVSDSLRDVAISMDIVSPLAFNVRTQKRTPEQTDFWTVEDFLNKQITKLTNTRNDTFTIDSAATIDVKPLIFDQKQPVTVSNGIIFPVDHWNYTNAYGYLDVEVKCSPVNVFQRVRYNLTTQEKRERDYKADYLTYSFNSATSKLVTDSLLGQVTRNTFMTFTNSDGVATAEFCLRDLERDHQVLSNVAYDVYIVMVPDFYRADPDSIVAMVPGETPFKKTHMNVSITRIGDNGRDGKTETWKFDYEGERVQEVYAGTVTFPYSYRNLPKSYPVITLSSGSVKRDERGIFQTSFSIDKIILRAKAE